MEASEYRLRPATNADGEAVRALVFGVLVEYGLRPDPDGTDADLADLESSYGGEGGWFVVAVEPGGGIVGTAGLRSTGPGASEVELRKMYLARAHRGRGLGRRLLLAALDEAKARGFRRVTLETAGVLREAVRMYERHGFRRAPACPHVCRCDIVMELDLEGAASPAA